MNGTSNGTYHRANGPSDPTKALAECPACDSPITREKYESILRITNARQKEMVEERAALQKERDALAGERVSIALVAVEQAKEKWQADTVKAKETEKREREALARMYEKTMAAEAEKRAKLEKQLARERAHAEARAKAAADLRVREAEQKKERVIATLNEQLKTSEQRRRRDEEALKRTIIELQQKAEARDRAHFGPEGEEDLVRVLREQFPGDRIEHRGKKGDVLQTVLDRGQAAGTVVYEVKKTKTWARGYLRQMKCAMESHGTKYGILVSKTLPSRRSGVFIHEGVIIVEPALAVPIVPIVRESIVALARLRLSEDDKAAKTAELFEYLRGEEFSHAAQIVKDKINELRESLSRERSYHDGWWRTREQHYGAILREMTGIEARVKDILGRRAKALSKRVA